MLSELKAVIEYMLTLKNHPGYHLFQNVVHGRMENVRRNLEKIEDVHAIKQSIPRVKGNRKQSSVDKHDVRINSQVVSCEVYNSPNETTKYNKSKTKKLDHNIISTSDSDSITIDSESDSDGANDDIETYSSISSDDDDSRIDVVSVNRIVEDRMNKRGSTGTDADAIGSTRVVKIILEKVLERVINDSMQVTQPSTEQIGAFKG